MYAPDPQPRWRPQGLALCLILSAVLFASWLLPATRALWDAADLWSYHALHGTLGQVWLWDAFWAFVSTRLADLLVGLLMLGLLIRGDWTFPEGRLRQGFFVFLALLVILLIIRVLFDKAAVPMGWQHASPSEQLGGYRLSEHFPWLERVFELKDRSSRSFPGDHASVLMLWGLYLALFTRGAKRAVVVAITVLFMLPRLVAGAHWMTDDMVSGVCIALLSVGLGYCTPLGAGIAAGLQWLARPGLWLGERLPLVSRLALLREGQR